jgi:hypothetical protein
VTISAVFSAIGGGLQNAYRASVDDPNGSKDGGFLANVFPSILTQFAGQPGARSTPMQLSGASTKAGLSMPAPKAPGVFSSPLVKYGLIALVVGGLAFGGYMLATRGH